MSWAADGQDGNELLTIFSSLSPCLKKLVETTCIIMVYSDIFLLVFYKHFCMQKVLILIWGTFDAIL